MLENHDRRLARRYHRPGRLSTRLPLECADPRGQDQSVNSVTLYHNPFGRAPENVLDVL